MLKYRCKIYFCVNERQRSLLQELQFNKCDHVSSGGAKVDCSSCAILATPLHALHSYLAHVTCQWHSLTQS